MPRLTESKYALAEVRVVIKDIYNDISPNLNAVMYSKRYSWDHFRIINWYNLSEFIHNMKKPTDAELKLPALAQYLYFHS